MTATGKRVILHIGFPRCGSTLLQREIFPQLKGNLRVVTPASRDRRLIDFLLEQFILSGRNIYLRPVTSAERSRVSEIAAEYPESVLLISCEGLVGDGFENMLTVPHLLRAVHVLFNEPEILLIIRRQPDMVRSYYRHALEEGYHKNFPTFVGFRDGQFTGFRLGRFVGFNVDPTALDFFNFVAFLETSFGSGKVHVLPYEWIQQNFDRFCGALAQITGAQLPAAIGAPPIVNRGLREGDIVLIRTLNRIWDSRIFGLPLIPRLTLLSHYERARRGGGVLRRIALAVGRRFSPLGALHVLGPVLTPLLNSLRSLLGLTGLKLEQEIEKAIEISVSDSNAALNQKLGGILTGLGYCDRR